MICEIATRDSSFVFPVRQFPVKSPDVVRPPSDNLSVNNRTVPPYGGWQFFVSRAVAKLGFQTLCPSRRCNGECSSESRHFLLANECFSMC